VLRDWRLVMKGDDYGSGRPKLAVSPDVEALRRVLSSGPWANCQHFTAKEAATTWDHIARSRIGSIKKASAGYAPRHSFLEAM
jgi:hypothetical protein